MKPYRPAPDPHPAREKFALARRELSAALIERRDICRRRWRRRAQKVVEDPLAAHDW